MLDVVLISLLAVRLLVLPHVIARDADGQAVCRAPHHLAARLHSLCPPSWAERSVPLARRFRIDGVGRRARIGNAVEIAIAVARGAGYRAKRSDIGSRRSFMSSRL
jgi:hypothetical protein